MIRLAVVRSTSAGIPSAQRKTNLIPDHSVTLRQFALGKPAVFVLSETGRALVHLFSNPHSTKMPDWQCKLFKGERFG